MEITITLDEKSLRQLIAQEIGRVTRHVVSEDNIQIEVKSKQNYKSEWEVAAFRATYHGKQSE